MGLKYNPLPQLLEGALVILAILVCLCSVFPVLILPSAVIYLCRWGLILYVKSCRHDLVRIVADNSTIFETDDLHKLPLCTLQVFAAFEGAGTGYIIENVRKCINERDPNTNELVFPETHQYFEGWMGYYWWKWEEEWNLDEHVIIWDDFGSRSKGSLVNEKDLMEIMGCLQTKPYKIGKSPWEVILIRNVLFESKETTSEIPKVVVILRCHHVLVDGFGILNMFMRSFVTGPIDMVPTHVFPKRSHIVETLYKLHVLIRIPYELARELISGTDFNQWHLPQGELTRKVIQGWTKRIPMPMIKQLKIDLGVGFSSVLVSCLSGAFRKMMLKQGIKVPEKIHAMIPAPIPDRKTSLGNHWSGFMQALNTGEGDPIRRVHLQQEYFDKIKSSTVVQGNFYLIRLTNILPSWCIRKATKLVYGSPTIIISNFPGPSKQCFSSGFPLVDVMFTGGILGGSIGIIICILSYDNDIRIVAGVDSAIFPTRQLMDEFIELIENEFSVLKEQVTSKVRDDL